MGRVEVEGGRGRVGKEGGESKGGQRRRVGEEGVGE